MDEYFDQPAHEIRGSTWETPSRPLPEGLSPTQKYYIQLVVDAQSQFESIGEEEYQHILSLQEYRRKFPHLRLLMDANEKLLKEFCERLPGFRDTPLDDRGHLYWANYESMLVLRFARKYDLSIDSIRIVAGKQPYSLDSMSALYRDAAELFRCVREVAGMRLHAPEYALLQGIIFFTGCPDLEQPEMAETNRSRYWSLLGNYGKLVGRNYVSEKRDVMQNLLTRLATIKGNIRLTF